MMAMVNPNAQAYAQNIALQAEIQGIREEMQKQAKQAQIAQEVQNRLIAANTNPRTEIIRELQTVIQPCDPVCNEVLGFLDLRVDPKQVSCR